MSRPPNIPKPKLANQFTFALQQQRVASMIEQGLNLLGQGKFNEAQIIYEQVLSIQPNHFDALQLLGALSVQTKQFIKAVDLLTRALKINPNHAASHSNRGIALKELGRFEEALISYNKAIRINPNFTKTYYNRGNALQELGRFEEALTNYDKAISIAPEYAEAYSNRGNALKELGRFEEALISCDKAIQISPDYAEAHSNRGSALKELERFEEAHFAYKTAIAIAPDFAELYSNCGIILRELRRYEEAIDCFDKALSLKPDYHKAWSNKAGTLHVIKRFDEAIAHYDKALRLKPDYHEAWSNKGVTLNELKRFEEAIIHYDRALSLKPDFTDAMVNRGMACIRSNMPKEALVSTQKALEIKGEYAGLAGCILLLAKLKLCDWSTLNIDLLNFENDFRKNNRLADPFITLLLSDNLEVQKKSSEIYAKKNFISIGDLGPIPKRQADSKLRLGYFSSDLYYHPVSIWLSQQLENHDKSQFELFAFSFTQVKDPMRARLENIFDYFIEVDGKSDLEVAQLSRSLGIDIAFDLCGYTGEARPGIFATRAAPIQVSHLGLPGTSGTNCIDYIISDIHSIPEHAKQFFTEKIAYVPCGYTYDNERQLSTELLTRAQFGLPQNAFVFTCQNGNQKITPEVFSIWMDILKAVPDSVLWLLQPCPIATQNLVQNALGHGIESDRLVFTKREIVATDQEKARISRYLSSYNLADLFLDTWPYNAGTTAIDALFSGLPVLTKAGETLVSRMATSALNAIEMPELITKTPLEYRDLAIELATDLDKLALIKDKIARNKLKAPLFDAFTNTKHLESAYKRMYSRYQADLQPDHIFIN